MDLSQRAKEIISDILYITIATTTKDGQPWNTPVYSSFDDKYNFFWASWVETQHSKNIGENNNVFLVIYDSTVQEGKGEGVYIKAKAYELTDSTEIEHATKIHYARKNATPRKVEEFLGNSPRRMYKAVPEKVWMNSNAELEGKPIDLRTEITL
jgi:general stress protein 26